jgi:hypothetical protein
MHGLILKQFAQLRLLDLQSDGSYSWRDQVLASHDAELIPASLDRNALDSFIDRAAAAASKNRYLMSFLEAAQGRDFPVFSNAVDADAAGVFPETVAYGIALNNLTHLMRDDWHVLRTCSEIWKEARLVEGLDLYMGKTFQGFEFLKLHSVEAAIDEILLMQQFKLINPAFGDVLLPGNIMEAVGEDFKAGYLDNAAAGTKLASFIPGNPFLNNSGTGQRSAYWSSDNARAIGLGLPLASQWADMYQTWNLGFVSTFTYAPYVMVKLLIPQVADYYADGKAGEYMYNRVLALYAHMHYSNFARLDGSKGIDLLINKIDWRDPELTRLWGSSNLSSANSYAASVKAAKK